MARSFAISRANPIHFRIDTGNNAVNSGKSYDENYLYPDIGTFYKSTRLWAIGIGSQLYKCTDTTVVQVDYDDDSTGYKLLCEFYDREGNFHGIIAYTQPFPLYQQYHNLEVDFSRLTCPGCYYIKIVTAEPSAGVALDWAGNGGFNDSVTWNQNWSSGSGLNTTARETVIVQAGASSAQITANGTPSTINAQLFRTDNQQAVQADTVYELTGYVYVPTVNPFGGVNDVIRYEVISSTDAIVLEEDVFTIGSDPYDTWTQIGIKFRVGQDTSIQFQILLVNSGGSTQTPQANGTMYIDTHRMDLFESFEQARSELIDLVSDDSQSNHVLVAYSAEAAQYGIYADDTVLTFWMMYRAPLNWGRFEYTTDVNGEDYDTFRDALGDYVNTGGAPVKVRTIAGDFLPPYMVEILQLSTLFSSVVVESIPYTRTDQDISIDYPGDGNFGAYASVEFKMALDNYDYKGGTCP